MTTSGSLARAWTDQPFRKFEQFWGHVKHWKGELLPFISACTGKEVNPILRCLEYEFSPVCSVRFAGKSQFVVIEFCYFDLGNACADNFPAVWTSLQANVNSHYGHRSVIFLKEKWFTERGMFLNLLSMLCSHARLLWCAFDLNGPNRYVQICSLQSFSSSFSWSIFMIQLIVFYFDKRFLNSVSSPSELGRRKGEKQLTLEILYVSSYNGIFMFCDILTWHYFMICQCNVTMGLLYFAMLLSSEAKIHIFSSWEFLLPGQCLRIAVADCAWICF